MIRKKTSAPGLWLPALTLALAWPLRGQFGHVPGAAIPGAFISLVLVFFLPAADREKRTGAALVLGTAGFALGGALGYGSLIDSLLAFSRFRDILPGLLQLFLIGGVWGGLGASFLAFAFPSPRLRRIEIFFLLLLAGAIFILLEVFHRDSEVAVLSLALLAIQLYNVIFKKSREVRGLGLAGVFGFGFGLSGAVLLLYLGQHGFFGSGPAWWTLRDQMWGAFGGLLLALAMKTCLPKEPCSGTSADSLLWMRAGLWAMTVLLVWLNTKNVLKYWGRELSFLSPEQFTTAFFMLAGISLAGTAVIFRLPSLKFDQPGLDRGLLRIFAGISGYLTALGIAKQTVPFGMSKWEPGYTLLLIFELILLGWITVNLIGRRKDVERS